MEETPPPPTGNAPHPSARIMGVQGSTDGVYEHGGTSGSGSSIATSHDVARGGGGGGDKVEFASVDIAGLSTLERATTVDIDMRWDAEVR